MKSKLTRSICRLTRQVHVVNLAWLRDTERNDGPEPPRIRANNANVQPENWKLLQVAISQFLPDDRTPTVLLSAPSLPEKSNKQFYCLFLIEISY